MWIRGIRREFEETGAKSQTGTSSTKEWAKMMP
jgi:hypothetical protein